MTDTLVIEVLVPLVPYLKAAIVGWTVSVLVAGLAVLGSAVNS